MPEAALTNELIEHRDRVETHLAELASKIGPRSIGTPAVAAAFGYLHDVANATDFEITIHESAARVPLFSHFSCSSEIAGSTESAEILPGVATLPLASKPMPVMQRIYASMDDFKTYPPDPGSLVVFAGGTFHESDACSVAAPAAAVAWFREGHSGLYGGTCARQERRPRAAGFAIDEPTARRWTTQSAIVTAEIKVEQRNVPLRNLIADIGPAVPKPCFMAHYDSKPMCAGANDNASGVAVLLSMLQSWPKNRPARFVFFDGEEAGILGSSAYVEDLAKADRLGEIEFVVCPDSVGLGELHLYTADSYGPFPEFLLRRMRLALTQNDMQVPERAARSGSSDYRKFHEIGIPCVFLSDFPNRVRHTTADVLDLVDRKVLGQLAVALSSDALVDAESS